MNKYEGKIVGILGTVVLHLAAAIIFMLFQIRTLKIDSKNQFVIEFAEYKSETQEEKEKQINLPATSVERILQGDDDLLNIARNLANKPEVKINPEEYIDKVKEELIKSGKLSEDNYIDEQRKLKEEGKNENLAYEKENDTGEEEKPDESEVMASNYQGPTRIYYDLKGRTHTYLPIPIYKCEGSGKVVLAILVDQKGIVEDARIIETESSTRDMCLEETAIKTALISRFNQDLYSPKLQPGTLTYLFVAQ